MSLSATAKQSLQVYRLPNKFGSLHTLIKFGKKISTFTKVSNVQINDTPPILISVHVHQKWSSPPPLSHTS
jgi:hypothetical protein